MRSAERAPLMGTRRIPLPRRHTIRVFAPGTGAVHDPLSLVLSLAPRRGIRPSARRARPLDAAVRAEIQSLRPVFQEPAAPRLEPAGPVLHGADREVPARQVAVVVGCLARTVVIGLTYGKVSPHSLPPGLRSAER